MPWQDFYKTVTNPYGVSGPHYNGGHHGVDFAASAHQSIPSYVTGTCVLNGHSSVLGNYTVIKGIDGDFYGWAHLLVGTRPDVGEKIKPGSIVGKAAGRGDDHGSAWTGPHCHTTRSDFETGIYDGRTKDPAPGIRAARAPKPASTKKVVTVKPGDTLGKIATANKTTVAKILALPQAPKITDPDIVKVGQRIRVS